MSKLFCCFFATVLFLQCAGAFSPFDFSGAALKGTRENASFTALPVRPLKFQTFYPQLHDVLAEVSAGPCLVSLQAYEGNLTARKELTQYGGVGNYCYLHNDCLHSTIYESSKSNMAAASVLLGLTPTILTSFGPAIAEIALLSSRRPLLSWLLSMGAPAAFPSRFLAFENPVELLRRPERPGTLSVPHKPVRFAFILSVLQYVLAVVAIVNLIATSLELGLKTVVSWRCSVSWLPLMWAFTPIACHAPAVLSFNVYRRRVKAQWCADKKELRLIHALKGEFTISANNMDIMNIAEASEDVSPGVWSMLLQGVATLFGILQVVFGTVVFSSLLYIGVEDATKLFLRYATSAFCCRLILYMELEGMIAVARVEKGKGKRKGEV
ncbi:hypothetical protein BU23DRAFT_485887 [Bimuria novae-zelandiae CBS 107.79]|uniref:Uncharacterized protein n=1 Tax=Bimuria novae-zelandiae CBS 107.79 TaxID=1447943 RepID=A0A6A5UPT5_9PLEO|nr:hypothetical protein BU23DRAFT_485887 [Bimuria novae-zelandiae CBS 107.79]